MATEVERLQALLAEKDEEIKRLQAAVSQTSLEKLDCNKELAAKDGLSNEDIARYSRQLILPEIGVKGQLKLSQCSVLIVGCGGLGCPAAIYLAAGGVGRIGLVDYDEVELSNLHRQVLHSERKIGMLKSTSAALACKDLNSSVTCVPYHTSLTSENAIELITEYDIVLDCSDNVATRYLLNDACVLAKKPLVSGSALRFEGQLTVYNHEGGPCYRCLFPKPPPPETVSNCSDGGVLGVVPGIIGSLQALEALKLAAGLEAGFSQKLLLFDALDGVFRSIKLRPKQLKCEVCGQKPTILKLVDYEQFCGAKATDKEKGINVLSTDERISVKDYKDILDNGKNHVLVDVRQPVELEICKLPNPSVLNIPMDKIKSGRNMDDLKKIIKTQENGGSEVFIVCRRGNDSQLAVKALKKELKDTELHVTVKDIKGGLHAWAKVVDQDFPVY